MARPTHGELFEAALDGDLSSWDELVDRLGPIVWSASRTHRLTRAQAEDVFQTVWLRLWDHRDRIENAEALPGWIKTTARNEVTATLRRAGRLVPVEVFHETERDASTDPLDSPEETAERRTVSEQLWLGFSRLDERCQQLLRLLIDQVPLKDVSTRLQMPVGSIGPTRRRCLDKLRDTPEVQKLIEASP